MSADDERSARRQEITGGGANPGRKAEEVIVTTGRVACDGVGGALFELRAREAFFRASSEVEPVDGREGTGGRRRVYPGLRVVAVVFVGGKLEKDLVGQIGGTKHSGGSSAQASFAAQ